MISFVTNAETANKCISCEADKPDTTIRNEKLSSLPTPTGLVFDARNRNSGLSSFSGLGNFETFSNIANSNRTSFTSPIPATSTPTVPVVNSWAASGFQMPSKGWVCKTCDTRNPDDSARKCVSCETERDGASTQETKAPSMPMPAVFSLGVSSTGGGNSSVYNGFNDSGATNQAPAFNWGASGFKPMEKKGWTCNVCMVPNSDAASKCISCEAERPGTTMGNEEKPRFAPPDPSSFLFGGSIFSSSNTAKANEKALNNSANSEPPQVLFGHTLPPQTLSQSYISSFDLGTPDAKTNTSNDETTDISRLVTTSPSSMLQSLGPSINPFMAQPASLATTSSVGGLSMSSQSSVASLGSPMSPSSGINISFGAASPPNLPSSSFSFVPDKRSIDEPTDEKDGDT